MRHIHHWMSRKPLEIEAWFQKTTKEIAYEESNGHVSDRCRHVTQKGQVVIPIRLESYIAKTAGDAI